MSLGPTLTYENEAAPNEREPVRGVGNASNVRDVGHIEKTAIQDVAAVDTTGVKLSYTVPASKRAKATGFSVFHVVGTTAVVDLELVRGAIVITLERIAAGVNKRDTLGVSLQAADIIRLNVTTVGAAGNTADLSLSIEELS